jgi:hypothetical protein
MSIFHKFSEIYDDIISEEDFNSSIFAGCEELLSIQWDKCLIASNYDEDTLSELFYFIEGDSQHIKHENNFLLCKLDDVELVLFDDYETMAIIINKKDVEQLESFI